LAQFAGLNTQVLGISVDHVPCLQAWAESLGGIDYPLLSDFWPHGAVAVKYGVLLPDGRSERAIFLIDKNGITRYIDIHDIDEQPDNDVLRAEIRKMDPEAAANESTLGRELATMELPSSGIVLYCTRWCPDCRRARAWFEAHNLPYTEVDVNAVPGAAAKVRSWADGKLITPTFDINGTIIIDYDLDRLAEVLNVS
jgi:glutaredoxin